MLSLILLLLMKTVYNTKIDFNKYRGNIIFPYIPQTPMEIMIHNFELIKEQQRIQNITNNSYQSK